MERREFLAMGLTPLLDKAVEEPGVDFGIEQAISERRFRIICTDRQLNKLRPHVKTVPIGKGTPEGTKVVDVIELWDRYCFGILVCHPTYPKVKHGDIIGCNVTVLMV